MLLYGSPNAEINLIIIIKKLCKYEERKMNFKTLEALLLRLHQMFCHILVINSMAEQSEWWD